MKKSYLIEVDCANCALKAEEAAKKTPGVQNAVVNFMAQKLIVEFAEGQDPADVMKALVKNCKKAVSDFEIQL
ncbi:MAG: cation transporter [Clostridia bacterium]|jgi:cation transport ATPase|nr:cation transporter [Clostridia bacterium]